MKISSINFIQQGAIPAVQKNTELALAASEVGKHLAKLAAGQALQIDGEFDKYTRYNLQKKLQAMGHKVLVIGGKNSAGKPAFYVKRLTDAEWREWQKS